MLIYLREGKLEKVNRDLFDICAVTKDPKSFPDASNMDILLPTSDLLIGLAEGNIGKKKFAKKYSKYLTKKNSHQEWMMYSIGQALQSKRNLCFTCTDKEFDFGYLRVLVDTIAEMFGVEVESGYKEAKEAIETELEMYSKKERKLLKADDDEELSPKKAKLKKSLLKDINKSLRSNLSEEGKDLLDDMKARYAIDQCALLLMGGENPVFELNKDGTGIKNVNVENFEGKSKDLVEAIMAPKDDDEIGEVVKHVLKGHQLKYKAEKLKDLGKENLINLIGELYIVLGNYRSDPSGKDDD